MRTWILVLVFAAAGCSKAAPEDPPGGVDTDVPTPDTDPPDPDPCDDGGFHPAHDCDGDGFSELQGDCDDEDPARHPGAPEIAGDGIDSDCDNLDDPALPASSAGGSWTPPPAEGSLIWTGRSIATGRDLDGDGYDELLVAAPGFEAPEPGVVWMFQGAPGLAELTPSSRWTSGWGPDGFGDRMALAGDIDGDGTGDVLILEYRGWYSTGHVLTGPMFEDGTSLHYDGTPAQAIATASSTAEATVGDLLPWPDVNGDGRDEVLVRWGGRWSLDTPTTLGVFETPLPAKLNSGEESFGLTLNDRDSANFISAPRDMDGDGQPEVLSVGLAGHAMAWAHRLTPGVHGVAGDPTWEGTAEVSGHSGVGIDGDWNGDGYLDGWMGSTSAGGDRSGSAWLLFGGPELGGSLDDAPRVDGAGAEDWMGRAAAGGDVDGDGHDDLIISAPGDFYFSTLPGRVHLFFGPIGDGVLDLADADYVWAGMEPGEHFGAAVATGDLDGDGRADIVVGAPRNDEAARGAGKVYVFFGRDL